MIAKEECSGENIQQMMMTDSTYVFLPLSCAQSSHVTKKKKKKDIGSQKFQGYLIYATIRLWLKSKLLQARSECKMMYKFFGRQDMPFYEVCDDGSQYGCAKLSHAPKEREVQEIRT